VAPSKRELNAPLAIILEPSKELAEQTLKQVQNFKKYLKNPTIKELLIVGGVPVKEQIASLKDGVDIVVATPGRLDDLISSGSILLNQVRFLIFDEVDGLLSQGHKDLIVKMYKQIPGVSQDGKRLQMIVCSATLHNFDVKKLADQIMHFPTWVDLKGQDSVPDTIHHCVCIIDPKVDLSWRNLKRQIKTDEVHANDNINLKNESKETLSEATKILKAEYCVRAIQKFKMDKALIFCRTKIDCDNMENYFISLGGGPKATGHQFSCVCLHADRSPNERTENLEKFKQNKVRLLICTDVAARGLDIGGLPFVINVTLPDDKQNYIHRIGRVGRAERMGLAISLVSKVQEKVWYHTCQSRGKNCYNTVLKEDGGCCIWYNEMQYLDDIEDHLGKLYLQLNQIRISFVRLGVTISQVPTTLDIPVDEFDGKVVYGQKRQQQQNSYKGHVEFLAPTVKVNKKIFNLKVHQFYIFIFRNFLNMKRRHK
jgi:ATP-dependent RNA helicase DDX1